MNLRWYLVIASSVPAYHQASLLLPSSPLHSHSECSGVMQTKKKVEMRSACTFHGTKTSLTCTFTAKCIKHNLHPKKFFIYFMLKYIYSPIKYQLLCFIEQRRLVVSSSESIRVILTPLECVMSVIDLCTEFYWWVLCLYRCCGTMCKLLRPTPWLFSFIASVRFAYLC